MGGLLAGLATLATPILARVLLALGMGVLTITGVALSVSSIKTLAVSQLAAFPAAALQLGGLLGVWQGLGMVFGAVTFAVTYWTLTKAVSIASAGAA
jgi:hypothetical protein